MKLQSNARRGGYTLLEVLIASLIALILLAGLYAALNVTLVRMDANRDQIAGNDLSRAVFNRVGADLANTLGPLPPKSGGDGTTGGASSSSSGASSTAATTGSSGTTGTSTETSAAAATTESTTTTTDGTTTSAAAAGVDIPFGAGIVGTDKQLKIVLSRTPAVLVDLEAASADTGTGQPSDLRSVVYYLAADGQGLCRQERPWVTADGVWNSSDPDRTDEAADIIAPEVKDLTFEYYDGGTWQSSWDGTATDIDGVSLLGPPRAIKVILVVEFRGRAGPVQKRVTQIVPIRSAVGNYIPETTTDSTTTATPTTGGN